MQNNFSKWPLRARLPLLVIAGVLPTLGLAPYSIWPAAVIGPWLLSLFLFEAPNKRHAFLSSLAFGLGMFGSGVSWVYVSIHDFGFTGVPLAILMTFMFVVFLALVFTLPFVLFFRALHTRSWFYCFVFASIWVVGEWARTWLLSGFPWLFIGYAHLETTLLAWAPIGGVFFIGFASVLSGNHLWFLLNALYSLCKHRAQPRFPHLIGSLVLLAVIWLAPSLFRDYDWTEKRDAPQSVALMQPNVELYKKWNPIYFSEIFSGLYELANEHWDKDIQLWPEAAIPSTFNNVQLFTDDIRKQAKKSKTNVFSGVLYDNTEPYEVYNSIVGLGEAEGTYFKQKLVPFGEYVPFEDQLRGIIRFFDLPNSVIRRGPDGLPPLKARSRIGEPYLVAPFICYEVVYPDFVAKRNQGADLLLTISNDAWFGDSIGPLQHFEMVRMRAAENQKFMMRATNTGVSGIIDERGGIVAKAMTNTRTSLTSFVQRRSGQTPFSYYGSAPIITLCFLLIGTFFFPMRLKQKLSHISGK